MNRDAFRVWLLRQHSRSIVGYAGRADDCPLARWWSERSGRSCLVRSRSYCCPIWSVPRPLPDWAWHFALLLDYALLEQEEVAVGCPVTREQALAVLVQVM